MAKGATIYKAIINVSDTDRNYYAEHKLTLAQHPSETLDRMMVRVLAFCLHASDTLEFTRGLSSTAEPALWDKDLTDQINSWIEVGQPPFERLKKARGQSSKLYMYTFGRGRDSWWQQEKNNYLSLPNLSVYHLDDIDVEGLVSCVSKTMDISVCITDGLIYFANNETNFTIQIRSE